jgi:hypothetical protein
LRPTIIERFKKDFTEMIGNKDIIAWSNYLSKKNSTAFSVEHPGSLFKLYSLYSYLIFPYLPIIGSWKSKYPEKDTQLNAHSLITARHNLAGSLIGGGDQ